MLTFCSSLVGGIIGALIVINFKKILNYLNFIILNCSRSAWWRAKYNLYWCNKRTDKFVKEWLKASNHKANNPSFDVQHMINILKEEEISIQNEKRRHPTFRGNNLSPTEYKLIMDGRIPCTYFDYKYGFRDIKRNAFVSPQELEKREIDKEQILKEGVKDVGEGFEEEIDTAPSKEEEMLKEIQNDIIQENILRDNYGNPLGETIQVEIPSHKHENGPQWFRKVPVIIVPEETKRFLDDETRITRNKKSSIDILSSLLWNIKKAKGAKDDVEVRKTTWAYNMNYIILQLLSDEGFKINYTYSSTNKQVVWKARYSVEAQQDLTAMHNIDLEQEFRNLMAKDIIKEIKELDVNNKKEITVYNLFTIEGNGLSSAINKGDFLLKE